MRILTGMEFPIPEVQDCNFALYFFTKFCQKTLLYTSYENVCEHMIFHNKA